MVKIPQMDWLRRATAVFGLYAFIWIALEGSMSGVLTMAVGSAVFAWGSGIQRWLSGRLMRWWLFVGGTAVVGLLLALTINLLTLGFMALKTGLHNHGPEFTPMEIAWVLSQRPLWLTVGYTAGLGVALLIAAFQQQDDLNAH